MPLACATFAWRSQCYRYWFYKLGSSSSTPPLSSFRACRGFPTTTLHHVGVCPGAKPAAMAPAPHTAVQ